MALDVDNVRFTPVRIREGYDMGQVDSYLDAVKDTLQRYEAALAGQGAAPAPLPQPQFARVRLREGYNRQEVDDFLVAVKHEIARLAVAFAQRGSGSQG